MKRKKIACLLVKEAGADYVKTSTGFSKGGATVEDVAFMRRAVGPLLGVKAAGGVQSRAKILIRWSARAPPALGQVQG